jgi:hypothetical protein
VPKIQNMVSFYFSEKKENHGVKVALKVLLMLYEIEGISDFILNSKQAPARYLIEHSRIWKIKRI